MAYTKLFQKILASSIWNEDVYTKVVWITMLAMKDQNQIVSASIGGLAHLARVPIEECRKAIEKLEGPDPDDSSGVREGRRIEPLEHGGWLVINGAAYRDSKDEDERRAWMANYMREYRKRKQNVNNRKHPLTPVNTSEQNRTEQNTEKPHSSVSNDKTHSHSFYLSAEPPEKRKNRSRPESLEELKTYVMNELKLTEEDAYWLWEHWQGNGFTVSGKPMKSWRMTASSWERMPRGKRNPYPSKQVVP